MLVMRQARIHAFAMVQRYLQVLRAPLDQGSIKLSMRFRMTLSIICEQRKTSISR